MARKKLFTAVTFLLILFGSITVACYVRFNPEEQKPFYVGVTYCGSSVQEAKELINKVKNYTNLFILQSGTLVRNMEAMNEIGDYACASNLNYAVYGSESNNILVNETLLKEFESGNYPNGPINIYMDRWLWLIEAKERWGEQFIGMYYADEPGGDMLDGMVYLEHTIDDISTTIQKHEDRTITSHYHSVYDPNIVNKRYYFDGRITVQISLPTETIELEVSPTPEKTQPTNSTEKYYKSHMDTIDYYPNGTITILENIGEYRIRERITNASDNVERPGVNESDNFVTNFYSSETNITKYHSPIQPYEQALTQNPVRTYDDAAKAFVNVNKNSLGDINKTQLNEKSMLVFTADYGLYWWDYQRGYDIVLAELGWNNTITQEIALVRGAANLQGKNWGTCITWKYTHPPYLTNGEEMYQQMKTSYQTGAQYIIIFNYSENPTNPNTLQEEHFQSLERFWKDVVQNPKIKHGGIKAEAALILPQNYGWGMRNPNDKIWGIWQPDNTSQQIWNQLQNKIDQYGLKLDIIFEDSEHPVAGKYPNIYYWDQR